MQRYVQLLFEHPDMDQRGQLWLCHWPPPLRRALSPLLQRLPLREGQATIGRIGRRATEIFRDLWDSYAEAHALTQPSPSDPDLFLDIPLPPSGFPGLLSPPSPTPTAARPWDARLAADTG